MPTRSARAPTAPLPLTGLGLLALLALFWGINWPMMKIAVADIPLLTFRAFCVASGAAGMLGLAWARGDAIAVPRAARWPLFWAALTNVGLWNLMVVIGVQLLPPGRAAILGYTMPVWATVLGWLLLGERPTLRRGIGVALGFVAMMILIGGDIRGLGQAPWGGLALIAGAIAWGLGVVQMKRLPAALPTTTATGWQMLLMTPLFVAGALAFEPDQWRPVGWPAIGATLYNMTISFNFCYWAWNTVVRMVPVAVSSVGSLSVPVVAVLSSMLMLGERPGLEEIAALTLVVVAIAAVAFPDKKA
jgi:drug/metabolite transporter (DMT)-like permease